MNNAYTGSWIRRAALICSIGALCSAATAGEPTVTNARDRVWAKSSVAKGAEEAVLWANGSTREEGVLKRWPSRTKLKATTNEVELHILVLAGTFTIDAGGQYRELGPGGFALIPAGTEHTLGCEAAGECLFLVHRGGDPSK